jgi:hypothetical protein
MTAIPEEMGRVKLSYPRLNPQRTNGYNKRMSVHILNPLSQKLTSAAVAVERWEGSNISPQRKSTSLDSTRT